MLAGLPANRGRKKGLNYKHIAHAIWRSGKLKIKYNQCLEVVKAFVAGIKEAVRASPEKGRLRILNFGLVTWVRTYNKALAKGEGRWMARFRIIPQFGGKEILQDKEKDFNEYRDDFNRVRNWYCGDSARKQMEKIKNSTRNKTR